MKRQALESGGWFDSDSVEEIKENSWWNGNNHISSSTGSQWEHEALFVTRQGRFVLHHWSQMQGSGESYAEISPEEAAAWLCKNEQDENSQLPAAAVELLSDAFANTEV